MGKSGIKEPQTGMVRNYDDFRRQMGTVIHHDREAIEALDKVFLETKDRSGKSVLEVAREHMLDPEKQRRAYLEGKVKRGR